MSKDEKNNKENKLLETIDSINTANILETTLQDKMPQILDILLIDRSTSNKKKEKNIIWASDNYVQHGSKEYSPTSEIKPELITGVHGNLIMPRALKSLELKKERTRNKGEVFTPQSIVKKQNDEIDKNYKNDDIETYVRRTWLEISCGEAPYMTTRYNIENGEIILFKNREGFVDRKLKKINEYTNDIKEWFRLIKLAYQSSYGFEWSGDSILIARENLLYTYRDCYYDKWFMEPPYESFKEIAEIISYNVFQMDGLKYIVPLSEKKEKIVSHQLSLFDEEEISEEWRIVKGKRVKIKDWKTGRMEFFDKEVSAFD